MGAKSELPQPCQQGENGGQPGITALKQSDSAPGFGMWWHRPWAGQTHLHSQSVSSAGFRMSLYGVYWQQSVLCSKATLIPPCPLKWLFLQTQKQMHRSSTHWQFIKESSL